MEELGLGPVLGHREVEASVPIVVGEGGAALIAVDRDPGDLTGHGLERAVSPPQEQQPAAGVVAGRPDVRGKEVLRQKQVFVPVTVEIRYARVPCRGELRLVGERHRLELPASIEEHEVVERRRLEALRALESAPEHVLQPGVRVRGEGPRPEPHRRNGGHQASERSEWRDPPQPVVVLGLDHVPAPRSGEVPVVQVQGMSGIDTIPGVAAPARRDDVEAPVPVQVSRRHAVPAAHDAVQTPLGAGVAKAPVLVQEQPE